MRKLALFCFLVVTLVCIVSCNNESVVQMGTLNVEIDTSVSKGIQAISMDTASYNLTIKNSSSNEVVYSVEKSTKTNYSVSVPIGTYTVEAEALNSSGDVIGTGSTTGNVTAGQSNEFTITITESQGNGFFAISISANEGYGLAYSIRNAAGTEVKAGNLEYSDGSYSASIELANGFYSFTISRSDTGKTINHDTLRVIKDKTAVYNATLQFLTDGSIAIVNEILSTPSITINLNSRFFIASETLTASATINGITNYNCYWVVDETPLSAAGEYADLELALIDYEEGEHSVALFVTDGAIIWSEEMKFSVLPDRPTELELSGPVELWLVGDVLIPWGLEVQYDFENYDSGTFDMAGHRIITLGDTVTLSCSINYPDYSYYLMSEENDHTGMTDVYIVIDKYVEGPAYLAVDIEKEYQLSSNQRFGLWTSSENVEIESSVDESRRYMGLIPITNKNGVRTIKVAPDTYIITGNSRLSANMPTWFSVYTDKSGITLSSRETETVLVSEAEYAIVSVMLPDEYEDGTEFFVAEDGWYNGSTYNVEGNRIILKSAPNESYSYILYQLYDKNAYYTVSFNKPSGESAVDAVKHPVAFTDTGITIPAGTLFYTTYTADCLIPANLRIQFRAGGTTTSCNGIGWGRMGSWSYSDELDLSLEICSVCADDYIITAELSETEDGYPLIIANITANYDDYALLDMTYDFDFDITSDRKTAARANNRDTGEIYYVPVVDKGITSLKAKPGRYNYSGCLTGVDTEEGSFYPRVAEFTATAGNTSSVTITMEP